MHILNTNWEYDFEIRQNKESSRGKIALSGRPGQISKILNRITRNTFAKRQI